MRNPTLKRSSLTLLAAICMVGMLAVPASAGGPIAVVTCLGTVADVQMMYVDKNTKENEKNPEAGLYLIGLGPARAFHWSFDSDDKGCDIVLDGNGLQSGSGRLTAQGIGTGWCGHSIGAGQGLFKYQNGPKAGVVDDVKLTNLWWDSVGTMLFVNFKHDGATLGLPNVTMLGNGTAVVNARAIGAAPGTGSCLDNKKDDPKSGARQFLVEIVAVLN